MLRIEQAAAQHLDQLVPLFDGYRVFYKASSDPDGARAFLTERLQLSESIIFMAYLDDVPVGFTQLYPSFTSVGMRRTWILNDLYVSPDARKHGVATALMQRAAEFGASGDRKYLSLQTAFDNFTAQRLYESQGWVREDFWGYELMLGQR